MLAPYIIFRIIGWFIIIITGASIAGSILYIGEERKPITPKLALINLILNSITIWFIYTAMQI